MNALASAPSSAPSSPPSTTRKPGGACVRNATVGGANSMMAAAIGLTSLSVPSPPNSAANASPTAVGSSSSTTKIKEELLLAQHQPLPPPLHPPLHPHQPLHSHRPLPQPQHFAFAGLSGGAAVHVHTPRGRSASMDMMHALQDEREQRENRSPLRMGAPSMPPRPDSAVTAAAAAAMMAAAVPPPPLPQYHHRGGGGMHNHHLPYSTLTGAAARPPLVSLEPHGSPYWPSAMRPSSSSFDALHAPAAAHRLGAPPTLHADPSAAAAAAAAAMAQDPFSASERIAAMDRAAAAAVAFGGPPVHHRGVVGGPPHPPPPYGGVDQHNNPYYPPPYASLPPQLTAVAGSAHVNHPQHRPIGAPTVPNNKNFPETLFDVISAQENAHIISWLPHGQGFIIHDKQRFASIVLPRFFDGAKFTSFTRRLKRWNFVRVPRGPELGAYYNKDFVRGRLELVQKMTYRVEGQFRQGSKRRGDSKDGEESEDPDDKVGEDEAAEDNKAPTSEPGNEAHAGSDSSPRPKGQDDATASHRQNPFLPPAHVPSPETNAARHASPQAPPVPLPGIVPKRPAVVTEISAASHGLATASYAPRNPPSINPETAQFPSGRHPRLAWPPLRADPNDRRHNNAGMMMPRDISPSEPRAMPGSGVPRPVVGGGGGVVPSSARPYRYSPNPPAPRMHDVGRTADPLHHHQADYRLLGPEYRNSVVDDYGRPKMPAPRPRSASRTHEEIISAAARGGHGEERLGGGERAVMMSHEEEEDFARYLIEKRRARVGGPVA